MHEVNKKKLKMQTERTSMYQRMKEMNSTPEMSLKRPCADS